MKVEDKILVGEIRNRNRKVFEGFKLWKDKRP